MTRRFSTSLNLTMVTFAIVCLQEKNGAMSKTIVFEQNSDFEDIAKCGEVFITSAGCLVFHCSVCEEKHEGYDDYWTHVMKEHYLTRPDVVFSPEDLQDSQDSDDDSEVEFTQENNDLDESDIGNFIESIETQISPQPPDSPKEADANSTLQNDGDYVEEFIEFEVCDFQEEVVKTEDEPDDEASYDDSNSRKSTETFVPETSSNVNVRQAGGRPIADSLKALPRKFKCRVCGKGFTSKWNLRAHSRRHDKNFRFQCAECPRAFISSHELTEHVRRHKGERPFLCADCGNSFFTSSALTEHIKRVHKKEKNLHCQYCDKTFYDNKVLKDHTNAHTNRRPYVCKICGASFPRQGSIYNHQKLHENKREYACTLCAANFNQKSGLFNHMKTRHKTESV